MSTAATPEPLWRVRVAIGRERAAEARMFEEMEDGITQLAHRISEQRGVLAALHLKSLEIS